MLRAGAIGAALVVAAALLHLPGCGSIATASCAQLGDATLCAQSLDAYCMQHICDYDLATAQNRPGWVLVKGCGCGSFDALVSGDIFVSSFEYFDSSGALVAITNYNADLGQSGHGNSGGTDQCIAGPQHFVIPTCPR